MQVQEIREQAKTLQGRSITAEGYLSVVGVGFLRNQTHIWWRPHAHHALVRAHSTLNTAADGQSVAITGEMAYLYADDEQIPPSLPYPPQLVFNQHDALHSINGEVSRCKGLLQRTRL